MANGYSKYGGYLAGDDQRFNKNSNVEKFVKDETTYSKSEERIKRIIGDEDD